MIDYAYLIPLIPLAASVIILFFGREGENPKMPYLGIFSMGWCFLHSACLFFQALSGKLDDLPYTRTFPWLEFDQFVLDIGVRIDGLALTVLFVVTTVSLLVHIYSLGYMRGDKRFNRYYAYLSFFTASMLGLVITSNLLILFACWELVGVASYLLIGFWFEKPGPAYAGKKAFITTKVGDIGFYIGLLLLFSAAKTFDLGILAYQFSEGYISVFDATAVGLLFLFAAIGKSAQIPLFIWLPDAMEGPTPVSALIHAATMVVAGIYLIARVYFIYAASPIALSAVAWTGVLTAFFAATMALTTFDIKRVLAFSTISQLGYMMLALGVGGYTSGIFHLTTHAFFKALLFLGAGSVIHAVHTNDMRDMGNLSKKMPWTYMTMMIATLAIAGFPYLFSGWYSKEAILHDVYVHSPMMWFIGVVTAGLTSFYMFRLIFLTFHGKQRDIHRWSQAHESPKVMITPLWILAFLSIVAGFLLEKWDFAELVHYEWAQGAEPADHAPGWLGAAAIAVFSIGAYAAHNLYGSEDLSTAETLRERFGWAVNILERRYYFDDAALWLVDRADRLADFLYWIDDRIIDRIFIDGWAVVTRLFSEISAFIDDFIVDGAVDGTGSMTMDAGWGVRRLVAGNVQEYLLYVSLAVMSFSIYISTR